MKADLVTKLMTPKSVKYLHISVRSRSPLDNFLERYDGHPPLQMLLMSLPCGLRTRNEESGGMCVAVIGQVNGTGGHTDGSTKRVTDRRRRPTSCNFTGGNRIHT